MSQRIAWCCVLALALSSCTPEKAPVAEPSPPKEPAKPVDLPADFMGVTVGAALEANRCDMGEAYSPQHTAPCKGVLGELLVPLDRVPTGFASELRVTEREGVLVELSAAVERGHQQAATNMVAKYGPPHRKGTDGELQWSDDNLSVFYAPPNDYEDGFVVIRTIAELRRQQSERRKRQSQKL